jgi:hypothetical protein
MGTDRLAVHRPPQHPPPGNKEHLKTTCRLNIEPLAKLSGMKGIWEAAEELFGPDIAQ